MAAKVLCCATFVYALQRLCQVHAVRALHRRVAVD